MAAPHLGPWEPLGLEAVADLFRTAPFRWWISGGRALELHLGRTWRDHDDTDVGVVRSQLPLVRAHLAAWDLHVAAAGQLSPWRGEPLDAARSQNNVWCRTGTGEPWALDLTIGEGTDTAWVYRRDPSVRRPWGRAVLRHDAGLPYLAPELQLLFKSTNIRPKDATDAAEVIPELDNARRLWLAQRLPIVHPWRSLVGAP